MSYSATVVSRRKNLGFRGLMEGVLRIRDRRRQRSMQVTAMGFKTVRFSVPCPAFGVGGANSMCFSFHYKCVWRI